jgi:outer membrane protein assembly factor BamD (BamD/ComL family)
MTQKSIVWALLSFLICSPLNAFEDYKTPGSLISHAKQEVRDKKPDFAFMHLRSLVQTFPTHELARDAQFAIGEYHFDNANYSDASEAFVKYMENPAGTVQDSLALSYLLKCARAMNDVEAIDSVEKKLKETTASEPVMLLFEKKKERKWTSAFNHRFAIKEFVDRLEITRDGSQFHTVQIS